MGELNPRLILIAGPNGSGKTEFTERVLAHEWLEGCEYINPDQIAQQEFGDWNSPQAVARAARKATDLRYQLLSESKSIALETVFSSTEKLTFIDAALKAGFFIRLFFVGTDNPRINAQRIFKRVMLGGHDVPNQKILDRFQKSIFNLTKVLPLIQRGYVYDNSIEDALPKLQFRTVDGSIQRTYAGDHAWSVRIQRRLEP